MKKLTAIIAALAILSVLDSNGNADDITISAECAIVIEANTGTVLYEKNADDRRLIASTTKIITAITAIENCSIDDLAVIPVQCESVEGTSLYLRKDQKWTMRELLYGLMLHSGNDAAVAVAVNTSGSVEAFCGLMNELAVKLGCENTHFSNPHGLDSEDHYSSARDMAKIAAYAMQNELFEEIVSTKEIDINGHRFKNHNKLLDSCYGVIGLKTGYTKHAGRTLVTCAERDGMRLICVTLGDPDDWRDHSSLYENIFSLWKTVLTPGKGGSAALLPVIGGTEDTVGVVPVDTGCFVIKKDDNVEFQYELPVFVYADVVCRAKAGELKVMYDGAEIFKTDLVFAKSVSIDTSQIDRGLRSLKNRLVR